MARISLSGTDIGWECADDDTIMRSALRAGLGFPYECNVGSCGNCRFDLIEGEITHVRADPPGLSERDHLRGRRLGCQARPLQDCTVKVRLMPRYQSHNAPIKQSATLLDMREVTHDIREFRFALDKPVQFRSGQYALLSLPGVDGNRAFSMCNTGADGSEWHFQIKRVPNGQATGHMFQTLSPGDRIGVDGPFGMAYLREDAPRDIVCIAGGSGLSPMVSIARAMAVAPALAGQRLDFLYGGRAVRDVAGRDLLEQLPGFGTNIHYHAAISATADVDDGWSGYRGFVHDMAADLLGHRLPSCEVYFAGPPLMGEAVQRTLLERGVPPEQIHFDQFY